MTNQTTQSLIKELTEDLTQVKRLAHPLLRTLPWFVVASAYLYGVGRYLGVRPDYMEQLTSSSAFAFENILAFALMVSAVLSASWLCIPDMREKKWMPSVTFSLAGVFLLWSAVRWFTEGMHMDGFFIAQFFNDIGHCFVDGLLLGFIPAVFILFITMRGKTTQPVMLGAMSLLSVTAFGYIGLRMICSLDTVGHSALYHLVPFVMAGGLLGLLARRIYKW